MLAKIIILAPILYFSALLQSSFLPHFAVFGHAINLIFIIMIFLSFFMPSFSYISAVLGGVSLDIFSAPFFGFNVLILIAVVFFIRIILRRYVKIPIR